MSKKIFFAVLLPILSLCQVSAQINYPVIVSTSVIPPVSPYFNQMLSGVSGRINVQLLNTGPGPVGSVPRPLAVKVVGHIECISPTPFTISLNPSFVPLQAIPLYTGQPVQLTNNLLQQAFGNFNDNNLVFNGISLSGIKDGVNYKLPEGVYRLCFTAYGYPSGVAVSDPNAGCTTVTVCYKAGAPQFVTPVNGISINDAMMTVNPNSPVIFTWTPPAITCGVMPGGITYDLEIRELLQGQTVTDAIRNPYVFQKQGLPSSTFILDTLLYRNILAQGRQYVIRVKANSNIIGPTPVEIDNQGYSRVEAFQYGVNGVAVSGSPGGSVGAGGTVNPGSPGGNAGSGGNAAPVGNGNPSKLAAGDCGIKVPANTGNFAGDVSDLTNQDLPIGNFKLHTTSIKKNQDGVTYSGSGYVVWQPLALSLQLAVKFDTIKVNTDKVVFDGQVNTTTDPTPYSWGPLAQAQDFMGQLGTTDTATLNTVMSYINKGAKFVDQLSGNTPIDMPLGLNRTIGSTPVTVAIMGISFSPKGTNMNILTSVEAADFNGWLSLGGTNFCIDPTGVNWNGTLYLPTDRDFNSTKGPNQADFTFKGCPGADTSKGTYLNIKNGAFDKIMARAELTFPQNVMVPEDANGVATSGSVVAKLQFSFSDWDDWMASVTLPNFEVKGVKGLSFQPKAISYDHSSKNDPAQFKYPAKVKDADKKAAGAFEGLYMQQLSVLLPADFKTFNKGKDRTSFVVNDFIVDDDGLSADIKGQNLIDVSTGNLGGWSFSLDTIEVVIMKNTFDSGGIAGKFVLPISSTPLQYTGDLHSSNDSLQYEFDIQPSANMTFDIWKAFVTLDKNSSFQVKNDSLGTAISLVLNGDIGFTLSDGSPSLKFDVLRFDSMGIANRNMQTKANEFWMSIGTWSFSGKEVSGSSTFHAPLLPDANGSFAGVDDFGGAVSLAGPRIPEIDWASYADDGSQSKVGGFPISINHLKPLINFSGGALDVGVTFDLNLSLGFGDNSVLGADLGLSIFGAIKADMQGLSAPKISLSAQIQVDSLKVNGKVGPITIVGSLVFYRHDNTFGDGLKGQVTATFPVAVVQATAQFGNVNNYNYWYIDASVNFPTAVPIPGISAIGINGFGGGAYYNMTMSNNLPKPDISKGNQLPAASSDAGDSTPGKSMSGVTFTPSQGTTGIMATVMFALTSSAKAMNGSITLTGQITNGAFSMLDLNGNVYVMTQYPDNSNPTAQGTIDIKYDFANNIFTLAADVQAHFGPIQANVPINLYAAPDDQWYFKIGDPDPSGQQAYFQLINDSAKVWQLTLDATAYFAMGTMINPVLPDLPPELIAHGVSRSNNAESMIQAMNQAGGNGMMFGAKVNGNLRFDMALLYARAQAIIGFDLLLKNFDQGFVCNGSPAGWHNWYALGQLYAYLSLDVGIHVDVWFYSGDLSLCQAMVAGALSAGLPNPMWLEGEVAVQGSLLDGLVSINTSAHFSVGTECYPAEDPLKDIRIISDCGPKSTGGVFDDPYVASNVGLNQNYTIQVPPTKDKPQGETRTYQFLIGSFTLTDQNGVSVPGAAVQYQNNNTTAVLPRTVMLKANTNYNVQVSCYAQQWYDGIGWQDPVGQDGKTRTAVTQDTSFSFKTGDAPNYIPAQNVRFAYPVNHERYVLKNEFGGQGRISLTQSMASDLFPTQGDGSALSSTRTYKLYFIPKGGTDTIATGFSVSEGNGETLSFSLPAALRNNTVYRAELWSIQKKSIMMGNTISGVALTTQVSSSTRTVGAIQLSTRQTKIASALTTANAPRPVYAFYFSTSQFNSLSDKVNALGAWNAVNKNQALYIQNSMAAEPFDTYEIKGFTAPDGVTSYPPLLHAAIDWNANAQNDAFMETVYGDALLLNFKMVNTDLAVPGLRDGTRRPVNTLDWSGFAADPALTNAESGDTTGNAAAGSVAGGSGAGANAGAVSAGTVAGAGTGTLSSRFIKVSAPAASYAVYLPAAKGNGIASKMNLSLSYNGPRYDVLVWSREQYLQEDFTLMQDFAAYAQLEIRILNNSNNNNNTAIQNALDQISDEMWLAQDGLGGSVTMPWNRFYYMYSDPTYMNMINSISNMKYTGYPKGSRGMRFFYSAGSLQGNAVNKNFTY